MNHQNTDIQTLEWIYGNSKESFNNTVQLSDDDIYYLLEHLFLNLMNLMLGRNTLGGACPDWDGQEQLVNWRLINLVYIKPGVLTKDEVKEKFLEICEVHDVEDDPNILGLFDRYIVSRNRANSGKVQNKSVSLTRGIRK